MGEIASVLMTMGTGGAGTAGMTAMGTGASMAEAAGAMVGGGVVGGIGAAIGDVAAAAAESANASVASDITSAAASGAEAAGAMVGGGVVGGIGAAIGDVAAAAAESANASGSGGGFGNNVKDFFGQAWTNAKNDLEKNVARNADGSVNYGKTAGNVGYGIAKSALLKAINAKDQEMPDQNQEAQPQPMKFSQPEAANAEDELNRLRNRMNVS